jgi:Protein of unknown function (DUF2690)
VLIMGHGPASYLYLPPTDLQTEGSLGMGPRRLLAVGARLIVAIALCLGLSIVVVPATAALAASCWQSSCTGKDPNSTGCGNDATDAVPPNQYWGRSFSVSLRRSNACSARWTRLIIDDWQPTCCSSIRILVVRQQWTLGNWYTANVETKLVGPGINGRFWTPMTPKMGTDRHQFCFRFETSSGYAAPWQCSDWG